MAWSLIIGGSNRTANVRRGDGFTEPEFELERNTRGMLRFDLDIATAPALRSNVMLNGRAGFPLFPGVLMRADPIELPPGSDPCWRCEVADYSVYADWCYWTKSYTTDKTLKQVLTDLFTEKLATYSLAVDPAQADGPTFTAPFGWTKASANTVIRDLVDRSGYVYTFGAGFFLMYPAGDNPSASPFDLTEADGTIGTLSVRGSEQVPANAVIAEFGPTGVGDTPITHTWIADGIATTYALEGLNVHASTVWPGNVVIDATEYPIWPAGEGPADAIQWDPSLDDGTLIFNGASTGLITAGSVISLTYTPLFPFTIERTSGASPRVEVLLSFPTVTDYAPAVATTEQALLTFDQEPRVFVATTLDDGLQPGQDVVVDAPSQSVSSADAVITRVVGRLNTDEFWEYEITSEETTDLQPDFVTDWRRLTGGSGSSSIFSGITGGGGGSTTALASPFPLGGSDTASIPQPSSAFTRVWNAHEFYAPVTFSGLVIVRAWLWARAAVNVQAELYCVTDAAQAAVSSVVAAGTSRPANPVEFACAIDAGKRYVLRAKSAGGDVGVYAIGALYSL